MYRYLSLFSGIGGFECGIGNRAVCIGYSEIDRHALHIYQRHFPHHTPYGDIRGIRPSTLPLFDLLVGGFPCQSFSAAGKRGGFADPRGYLFFEIARIIRYTRPNLLLLENVKGLLDHERGATFALILCALQELGYDLQWQVLNSKNHGVPQNRERLFIIGHTRGKPRPEVFPFSYNSPSLSPHTLWSGSGRYIQKLWRRGDSVGARLKALRGYTLRHLTPRECERLQGFPDGWTEGISDGQRYKCLGNAVTVNVIDAVTAKLLRSAA